MRTSILSLMILAPFGVDQRPIFTQCISMPWFLFVALFAADAHACLCCSRCFSRHPSAWFCAQAECERTASTATPTSTTNVSRTRGQNRYQTAYTSSNAKPHANADFCTIDADRRCFEHTIAVRLESKPNQQAWARPARLSVLRGWCLSAPITRAGVAAVRSSGQVSVLLDPSFDDCV